MSEKIVFKVPKLEVAPFSRAKVTIIVPFHGQYEKVTKLVRSIVMATRSNPYEIVLVDDCSPNRQFIEKVKGTPQVKTFRSEKHLGMGRALKLGFESTKQPWVVFLNSDCVIEKPNWLIEMGRTLIALKDQKVKMVSARMDNMPGYSSRLKSSKDAVDPHYVMTENEDLPLTCVMCHRDLFKHIGGFVKSYPLGYEDEELAHRMRKAGYKQAISGISWVHHDGGGGATLNQLFQEDPEEFKKKSELSREMCIEDIRKLKL